MSNGTSNTWNPTGLMCPAPTPQYPPTVTLGQDFPEPEDGPQAVPPGCAPGLPTLIFAGGWQH